MPKNKKHPVKQKCFNWVTYCYDANADKMKIQHSVYKKANASKIKAEEKNYKQQKKPDWLGHMMNSASLLNAGCLRQPQNLQPDIAYTDAIQLQMVDSIFESLHNINHESGRPQKIVNNSNVATSSDQDSNQNNHVYRHPVCAQKLLFGNMIEAFVNESVQKQTMLPMQ